MSYVLNPSLSVTCGGLPTLTDREDLERYWTVTYMHINIGVVMG